MGEALAIYARQHGRTVAAPATIGYCIKALAPFWAERTVDEVKGETCRLYAKKRGVKPATARRELGVLNAALRYCHSEGYLSTQPRPVTLPTADPPRDRWLTRQEAAALLRAAGRFPHLRRYILIALYTGSRSSVIRKLQWTPNFDGGHVDLDAGVLYRQSATARRTNKRAPAARIPRKLLNHLRRWRRMGGTRQWVVEYNGARMQKSPQNSWRRSVEAAGIAYTRPHDLRHTALTWMMQRGALPADVCSLAGITLAELERTYLHHSPNHQKSAVDALGG